MLKKLELWRAVRYEVAHFQKDIGFTVRELWDIVNGRVDEYLDFVEFWTDVCLGDYRHKAQY